MSKARARRRQPDTGPEWRKDHATGTMRRDYPSYEVYAAHQASKLATMGVLKLIEHHERLRSALFEGLRRNTVHLGELLAGSTVLCLGARTGAEVEAFHMAGAFAVGIDLNPGQGNRHVLTGDFHRTVFPAGTVDYVYTNAIDHTYDPRLLLSEVRRLLRAPDYEPNSGPGGAFIVDAMSKDVGPWESFAWTSTRALFDMIEAAGFRCTHREQLVAPYPWPGERAVMVRQ